MTRILTRNYHIPLSILVLIILLIPSFQAISQLPATKIDSLPNSITPIASTDSISLFLSFDQPQIQEIIHQNTTFTSFYIPNITPDRNQLSPQIPVKTITLLLPPDTIYDSFTIEKELQTLQINSPIYDTTTMMVIGSNPSNQFPPINPSITSYTSPLPSHHIKIAGMGQYRGYSLLKIHIYPIIYDINNDEIVYSSSISLTVHLQPEQINTVFIRNLSRDKTYVQEIVENPSMIDHYEEIPTHQQPQPLSTTEAQYLIITSKTLEQYFEPLKLYKQEYLSAKIINLTFITQNFHGVDLQDRIREFIKYAYVNWHTDFVLLGGDVNIVPYRGLWGEALDHDGVIISDNSIPADIYYAGLDGSWDEDGDYIYGEDGDHSLGEEADFFAEIYVGRAPVENEAEIGTFINKVITYETSQKPTNILLHQSGLNTRNNPDSSVIPESCAQYIPDEYEITRLYQINDVVTPTIWLSQFADDALIVEHTGNGELDQYYLTWPTNTFSTFESLSLLENNFYPIHTSVACHSGSFEKEQDCLAETFLLNP